MPDLHLSSTREESPYRPWRLRWQRYGLQGWRLMAEGKQQVGLALREPDGGWYFVAEGLSRGVAGLKSRRACVDFFLNQVVGSPWHGDRSAAPHVEWSPDGVTWTVKRTDGPIPPEALYYRWVGVGMVHRQRQPGDPEPELEF